MPINEDLKPIYLEYIEDYCNFEFNRDKLPAGVKLSLDILIAIDPMRLGVASETVGDLSISYKEGSDDMPAQVVRLLKPYMRPHLAGDKTRRLYERGKRR